MTEILIRNKNILAKLDYILQTAKQSSKLGLGVANPTYSHLTESPKGACQDGEKYMDKSYLDLHLADPEHKGFPVEYYAMPFEGLSNQCDKIEEVRNYVTHDFVAELGANSDALFNFYPPGGFVGWHTNQNNSGHQFLFTWSQTGDGYFQYYDKQKDEIIRIDDVPGWQCRHYHFGKDKPDHCWHSAYTNVPRITVCVLFRWWDKPDLKDQILEMKDQLIEEIESEE